jgi:hypothetical protein
MSKKGKKSIGPVLALTPGLKMTLLPLGPSSPLQAILLSDLVGCGSPLQIVIAVCCTFFKFEVSQTAF